jgi:hypothetical protein
MTKREWLTSWKKSPNGCAVAKEFEKDMIFRTIVKKSTKSLVNSNNNGFIQNSNDDDDAPLAGDAPIDYKEGSSSKQFEDFEEVSDEAVVVDTATGEIKEIETKEEDKLEF